MRAVNISTRWLAKGLSALAVGLTLAMGATALAQADELAKWKPFQLLGRVGPPQARVLAFGAQGSYRIIRQGGKFIKIEVKIDDGVVVLNAALNQKRKEPFVPRKVQLVAGYRLPNNKLWMIPFHMNYAAEAAAPSRIRLVKKTSTQYNFTSPVLTFSVANEDQDLSKYVLFASLYVTKAGAYIPAQSAKLQP